MHPDKPINFAVVGDIRATIRRAQLRLMADPDPSSPWWFLVDPDAYKEDQWPTSPSAT